jgi:hypothetical protein
MSELDLKDALLRAGPAAEYFKNKSGTVQHLGLPFGFQIALLHRRELGIDHYKLGFRVSDTLGNFGNLAGTNISCGLGRQERRHHGIDNIKIYRFGEPYGFGELALRIPVRRLGFSPALALNMNHNGTGELWAFNLEIYAGT